MTHLSLNFLGGFEAAVDGQPVTAFGADKARALLAFLAIESSNAHRRDKLTAMFWPELSEKKAAHNLSQNLLRLRKALGEQKDAPNSPFLIVTRQELQFNGARNAQIDVLRFRKLFNLCDRHNHPEAANCGQCAQWRTRAAELYQGDLLAGFFIPDSLPFEEWRLIQQEELHRQALETFTWLAVYHEQRGELDQAQVYARRQIALEPWREEAHIQLMRTLAQTGQAAAALQLYEQYQHTLTEELGIKPSAAAARLYEQLRSGEAVPQTEAQPVIHKTGWLSSEGERRQATVLACNPGNQSDGEAALERIGVCQRRCEGIFRRFGGRRAPRQGNACLVYFGYPQAYEDAARRAVHAGLAVAVSEDGADSAQIGIHTGMILVGENRGLSWQDRDLVGTVFDVARDCQRQAQPGTVVITEATRQLALGAFDVRPLPANTAQGERPFPFYQVLGAGDQPDRLHWLAHTQRLTALAGRAQELRQLKEYRDRARQGYGQTILLQGEPGIGKSRLVWELKASAPAVDVSANRKSGNQKAMLWLSSACLPHYQNSNLFPIIQLLEQLLGFQEDDSAAVRREKLGSMLSRYEINQPSAGKLMSRLLGLPAEEPAPETITKAQREQMRTLFVALVKKRAEERPLTLAIEDLQWSDPSTAAWLGKSINSLAEAPCLMLLTARPGFNPIWLSHEDLRPHMLLIPLAPLPPEEASRMVTDLAGEGALDEALHSQIVSKTDGIPLFVEELTKSLIENTPSRRQLDKMAKIPATLLDSLGARLDHLGGAKETAQWAAALGREFSYAILQACAPFAEQRLQGDLAQMIEAELVSANGGAPQTAPARYAFRHALMRDAAYASLLKRTRQTVHRRIAETLETRFPQVVDARPEILAEHFASANARPQAVDYWLLAGNQAKNQGALMEAKTFFNQAIQWIKPEDAERRWQAFLDREDVLDLLAEREAQKKDIEVLLELAEASGDDVWQVAVNTRLANYAARVKDFELQLHAAETAIAAARRSGNLTLEVREMPRKVGALTSLEEWSAAEQAVEDTLAKLSEITDDMLRVYVLGHLAFFYGRVGDLFRALSYSGQAAEAAHDAGMWHRKTEYSMNSGCYYSQLGRYTEACETFEGGLALAESIEYETLQSKYKYNLSYALWCSGDRDAAQVMGKRALHEFETTVDDQIGHACCLFYLGVFAEDEGEWSTAADYLAEARERYLNIGVGALRMEGQAVEARCLLNLGRLEDARQLALEVWTFLREKGTKGMDYPSRVYLCIADVLQVMEIPGLSESEVISAGYDDLMQRADKISDAAWRQSFLENVAENKAVVEQWNKFYKVESQFEP